MIDSPFLPGTKIQYAWDSTSLGMLKQCPRLYQYTMIDGWAQRDASVHLRFGIEYHEALQDYDLSRAANIPHAEAVHDTVRELLIRTVDFESDHKTKSRDSLVRTVIWYLDKFRDDAATTVIRQDGSPAVEVSFRFELDFGPQTQPNDMFYRITSDGIDITGLEEKLKPPFPQPYLLCGHLDRVVNFNDEVYVMDRKTSSYAPTSWYFDKYEPDNQMSLYSLAGRTVLQTPIRGVIIDAAQIKEDESIFGRGFTFRTEDQLKEWLADLRFWLVLAEQYAVQGYWPQNDTACDKFGGCRFRNVCSKSPSVRERFLEADFVKQSEEERWNPLRSR